MPDALQSRKDGAADVELGGDEVPRIGAVVMPGDGRADNGADKKSRDMLETKACALIDILNKSENRGKRGA